MSSAKTSTAKKPSKAPPAKKTASKAPPAKKVRLAEKSHKAPKDDSSDESSSVAQTKKATPHKKNA